jgi:hypothetical protein
VDFIAVNNFGDTRSGGLAGPMGLFIIVLMSIATVLLIRNMNKRLRRLPDSFTDVDAKRRQEEIDRLDAELTRPDALPGRSEVDGDRLDAPRRSTDPQVNAPDPKNRPTSATGGPDQA